MVESTAPAPPTYSVTNRPGVSASPYPQLSRAPIREALIYFRVDLSPQFDLVVFRSLRGSAQLEGYPKLEENRNFSQTVELNPTSGVSLPGGVEDHGLVSYVFHSTDGLNVAQFRRDGFVFSRLRPYSSWTMFFSEAWRLWKVFCNLASPKIITRLGVRYINQLNIPAHSNDLSVYLNAAPRLAPTWPNTVGNFLTQTLMHLPEHDAYAQVSQTLRSTRRKGILPLLLDVDVFSVSALSPDDPELANRFHGYRAVKNRIFSAHSPTKRSNLSDNVSPPCHNLRIKLGECPAECQRKPDSAPRHEHRRGHPYCP